MLTSSSCGHFCGEDIAQKSRRHKLGTFRFAVLSFCRGLALLALIAIVCGLSTRAAVKARAVWVRLELVENTADGSAFNRCEIEGTLKARDARTWRIFYGEAQAGATVGWEPVHPRSGCWLAASDRAANPWTLRGWPYLLVDVTLEPVATSENEVRLQASMTIRRLAGFGTDGKPTYEQQTESRTLRVRGSAVIPILVASRQETEAFGVRELLMRFRVAGSRPRVEYGEVAITADVPRAMIFLDGGLVGRTSSDGPLVLRAVRTGKREIAVVDPSGREARATTRVEKGSRTDISITLLPKSPASGLARLRPLGRNPQGSEEFWREKDSAIVVRIPGGEFRMGSAETEGEQNERPQHVVRVRNFLIDKTEVTWGQYRLFATKTARRLPRTPVWGTPEAFPASYVTWEDAQAFCSWAGGRLPTEAEWERAARGSDARRYPWGDNWDPARCNSQEGGPHSPTASATYPDCVSPYGVLDLAGSVWEWCEDWFDLDYYARSPVDNPKGPETGSFRVSRGGNWISQSSWVRSAIRQGILPGQPDPTRGFRCAQDDPEGTGK